MVERLTVRANGIRMNLLRAGNGPPLLLHGWPEFSAVWKRLMPLLSDRFTLYAPDFRGFGESENPHDGPSDQVTADVLAEDMHALVEALGITGPIGIVSHDVGGQVAQTYARRWPDDVSGLFFFNCPYPGIGSRWGGPGHLKEIWYQSFHQLPWAAALVGESRATVKTYIGAFLRHWAADPHAFDNELEAWVDNFVRPGNLQGGFNWYISVSKTRLATIAGTLPKPAVIHTPTRVFWGEADPVLKSEWMDRLGEYFSNLKAEIAKGAGHFVHFEQPEQSAKEIRQFFGTLVATGQ